MAANQTSTGFSLKDALFNRERVTYLAGQFSAQDNDFDAPEFIRDTMRGFKQLELKQRIVHITEQLEKHLASDYRSAALQIQTALPPKLDPSKTDDDFGDFIFAPLGEFVARNGLAKKDLTLSLKTLCEITQRFSMEDAIRRFIDAHTDATLKTLAKWSTHANYHVRRLVSEGTRPLLPWSGRLSIDISAPLPMLETLHADGTRYVTRSVANHLNDIAKKDPKTVVTTLRRWKKLGQQDPKELAWMTRHALRTLVKQGDPAALKLLGYSDDPKVTVSEFQIQTPNVKPGQAVEFSFSLAAARNESLMVDYVVDFVKSSGKLAPKVHKLKQLEIAKGGEVDVKKRHPLRANATTYTLYPGTHFITLQINGKAMGRLPFELQ